MKVEIELNEAAIRAVSYLKDPITGEPLQAHQVFQILADDLGLTQTRPESWEGLNMQSVIDGHGWENHLGEAG